MTLELLLLFIAGLCGGILNSVAGGGSFITFPALLMAGVPPISANATNTFASCAGYMSGTYALRRELRAHRHELLAISLVSLSGGITGAWLLLQTSDTLFRQAIPWLLLLSMLLFIYGGQLNGLLKSFAAQHRHASLLAKLSQLLMLLAVSVYGGFFNAGLGIITLSYLALAGHTNINAMNGLKLLIASAVSLIAIALFIYDGAIAWQQGTAVLLGTLAGGYAAARLSRQLPQHYVRGFVIVAGCAITGYFFLITYS